MFRVWSAGDDLKNETFSSSDTARPRYYLGIEGLEVRDNVNKVDLGRPLRNIWENTQHLSDFNDRMFYHVRGDSSGVFSRSLVNGFSIGDTDIVTVTVNPGTGDTIRFYARLGPGIAYHNKHVIVNRPQTQIAERQISKILGLDDWKDESVSLKYFFNTDLFQAKITKRNTNGTPISYYFVDPAFYGDSTKWGDSRVGYSSSLKLFEGIYNASTFTSFFRTWVGDSIDLIQCEPVVNFKKSQITFAGDTIFWVVKPNGNVIGTTTHPAVTDLRLWATKVNITAQVGTTVNKGDSRKYISMYQDFGQHIFLNVPKQWGADTTTLTMAAPSGDTRNHPYTFVNNRDSFIIFLNQSSGVGNNAIFGWSNGNALGVLPARSGVLYGNKDLVLSRWTNAGDTLGRAWASVMSMSGDSWTFYGDKMLQNGSFFPSAANDQWLGRPGKRWKLFADSANISKDLFVSGNSYFTGNATFTGDVAINGGDITSSASWFNLLNTSATDAVNIGQFASTVIIGDSAIPSKVIIGGDLVVKGDSIVSTKTSFSIAETTSTTVNLARAATTISMGALTGTTTIRSKRTVVGSADGDSFIVRGGIVRLGSGDSNGIFMLSRRISAGDTGKRITAAGGDTGILFRGSINAYKVYNAVWNDYAEAFAFDPEEKHLVAGYVYAQGPNGAVRARKRADKATLGVFSDTYAMLLGSRGCISEDKNGNKIPIALAGKVKLYAKGKLEIGDLLVTDKNGFGVKATFLERIFKADRILGKVLEANNEKEPTRIWMLVR